MFTWQATCTTPETPVSSVTLPMNGRAKHRDYEEGTSQSRWIR